MDTDLFFSDDYATARDRFRTYDYPQGLFYGGDRPSRMSEILGAHFDEWLGDSQKVIHVDFHTGLGKWANYKLLIDYPVDEPHR